MQLDRDSRHTVLVSLVACAVGGTASAAVILGLVDFAMTQASGPPISSRAIVLKASASQDTRTIQSNPVVEPARANEPAPAAQNSPAVETPTVVAAVSPADEPVTQTKVKQPPEVHSHQSRKHSRVSLSEHHWRRFAYKTSASPRFSLW